MILGNGRYFAMRKDIPFLMQNFGFPKMLVQLNIEYTDGSKDMILSDESWKLTANGPITENNEFDGEKYDARLEMAGWDKPDFDYSKWIHAQLVAAPAGKLTSQLNEPIRVTGHIKPVSVKPVSYTHLDVYKRQVDDRNIRIRQYLGRVLGKRLFKWKSAVFPRSTGFCRFNVHLI